VSPDRLTAPDLPPEIAAIYACQAEGFFDPKDSAKLGRFRLAELQAEFLLKEEKKL
jgi:hypothetical protein